MAPLPRFFLLVLVLLVPCYLFWYLLHPWIANPLSWALDVHLRFWMPDQIHQVRSDGVEILIYSTFGELNGALVSAKKAGAYLAFPFDSRIVTYALPFYAALTFATPGPDRLDTVFRGFLVLFPIIYLCALGVGLQNLSRGLGGTFDVFGGSDIYRRSLLALYFQLSTLILPVLAPVVVWAWQSRRLQLLAGLLPAPSARDED